MIRFSGKDLREVFKTLGIDTGDVSSATIDSWFDTDCEDTKNFLNWLCRSLTSENVLTTAELNEYEELAQNNLLLSGTQYEATVNELKSKYPGILDYETSVLDAECMEDDLKMLLEEEKHLEGALTLSENVGKVLLRELAEKTAEEVALSIERKDAEEKCMQLSCQLDEVNKKVQQQICRNAKIINKYTKKPLFLSRFPLSQYEQYYTNIESYINILLKRESKTCPNTVVKSARKRLSSLNADGKAVQDELEILQERIFKSTYSYFCKQIEKDMLLAQIRFLEEADLKAISQDESLEMNNILKSELLDGLFKDLENVCKELSASIIEKARLPLVLNMMDVKQQNLDNLTTIDDTTTKILSSIILLQQLINIEHEDVKSTYKFFRDIHYYINNNLQKCELRIKSMREIIENYNDYKNIPLDEKLKFARIINGVLGDKSKYSSALDIIKQFDNECTGVEQQVFFDEAKVHRQYCEKYEHDVKIIQRFLTGGPTSYIITFPHEIMNTLSNVFSILDSQNVEFQSTLQAINNASKLSKDKWLKMKRLFSMWYLFKPNKMLLALQDIEAEITKRRNENV